MFQDPKLFRQARTIFGLSKREIAETAGEKESSVADVEAGRKKLSPELAFRLWAASWGAIQEKKQHLTKDQMERNDPLLEMMWCAHHGLTLNISPEKLLAWVRGEGEITSEEEQRYYASVQRASGSKTKRLSPEAAERIRKKAAQILGGTDGAIPIVPRLTFEKAKQMPVDEVIDLVLDEIESRFLRLSFLVSEKPAEDIEAQVIADPRVQIAGAKAWIKALEKERDDLQRQLLEANKELLSVYRRIAELEKVTDEELVAIVAPVK